MIWIRLLLGPSALVKSPCSNALQSMLFWKLERWMNITFYCLSISLFPPPSLPTHNGLIWPPISHKLQLYGHHSHTSHCVILHRRITTGDRWNNCQMLHRACSLSGSPLIFQFFSLLPVFSDHLFCWPSQATTSITSSIGLYFLEETDDSWWHSNPTQLCWDSPLPSDILPNGSTMTAAALRAH